MKYVYLFLFFAIFGITLNAQVSLIQDANNTGYSNPYYYSIYNGHIYFRSTTESEGTELWQSDGTSSGTILFKDVFPGNSADYQQSPNSSNVSEFVVYKDKLYFFANRKDTGSELWQSDGTPAGTALFKDIAPGEESSVPRNMAVCNNNLYFSAQTYATGSELWITDGTAAGTRIVKDIYPGIMSSGVSGIAALNDRVFFAANDGNSKGVSFLGNQGLWVSDGTESGTKMLKKLNIATYTWQGLEDAFTLFNDELYFNVLNQGYELWKTDGTTEGTKLVHNLGSQATNLTVFNDRLYFVTGNSSSTANLYSTKGTSESLKQVLQFQNTNATTDYWSVPINTAMIWGLTEYNNRLFFQTKNLHSGAILCETNGVDSVGLVHNFREGRPGGDEYVVNYVYNKMIVFNDKLYMSADDGINGTMMWEYTYQPVPLKKIDKTNFGSTHEDLLYNIITYPNPSTDIIHVSSTSSKILTIVCKNALGASVYSANPNKFYYEIDVSNIAAGLYTLEIQTVHKSVITKIQVVK